MDCQETWDERGRRLNSLCRLLSDLKGQKMPLLVPYTLLFEIYKTKPYAEEYSLGEFEKDFAFAAGAMQPLLPDYKPGNNVKAVTRDGTNRLKGANAFALANGLKGWGWIEGNANRNTWHSGLLCRRTPEKEETCQQKA